MHTQIETETETETETDTETQTQIKYSSETFINNQFYNVL